jgi:hypothetical protein
VSGHWHAQRRSGGAALPLALRVRHAVVARRRRRSGRFRMLRDPRF